MNRFKIFILLTGLFCTTACTDHSAEGYGEVPMPGSYFAEINTDRAVYLPGSQVHYRLTFKKQPPPGYRLLVRCYHLDTVVARQNLTSPDAKVLQWQWQPPEADFKGYLTEVLLKQKDQIVDQIGIAVDVSSDWRRFPRYGFISDYSVLSSDSMDAVLKKLNRYHINGLQFYDWHHKHHAPLSLENGRVSDRWIDIGKRDIHRRTVEYYLAHAEKYGMKTMAYNLLYGAWEDAPQEGAPWDWRLYKNHDRSEPAKYDFDENWASDLYWMNPANPGWQEYIAGQTAKVFKHLDFDGWHVDQLGDWGVLYDHLGKPVNVAAGFKPFLTEMKKQLGVPLVMNAVGQYGQDQIADSPVEFLYTEVWDPDSTYNDLLRIIETNDSLSDERLRTVLAAYVNQGRAEQPGYMHEPALLTADAVILAGGGFHLEMGEHLLVHPYFPNHNLKMSTALERQLLNYYDFAVAYQNLLRGSQIEKIDAEPFIADEWLSEKAVKGKIWIIARKANSKTILHLVNLQNATTLNWRDDAAMQAEPKLFTDLQIRLRRGERIKNAWCASPDLHNSIPQKVDFRQHESHADIIIPFLKYWTMLVLE